MKENRIEELRRKKNLSQEELADILEVSRQTVSEWERKNAYPSVEKLIKLSEIFDVSLDYLVRGRDFVSKEEELKDDFLKQTKTLQSAGPLVLGKKNGLYVSIPEDRDVGSTLVCAGAGQGKTVNFVLPNILKAIENEEAIIVTDPKGELKEVLTPTLDRHGYNVKTLNLNNPEESDKINLLDEISFDGKVSATMTKMAYNYLVGERDPNVFAMFSFLLKTGVSVSEMINGDDFSSSNSLGDIYSDLDGLVKLENEILRMCPKEDFKKIKLKLKANLNAFSDTDMTAVLSQKEFMLKDVCQPKTILFLEPNIYDTYGQNIIGLVLEIIFDKILLKKVSCESGISIFLDEYGVVFNSNKVLDKITSFRDNVKVSIIVQSLNQIKHNPDAVLNGFYNYVFMGSYNIGDIDRFASFFGVKAIELESLKNKLVYKRRGMDSVILEKNPYYKK